MMEKWNDGFKYNELLFFCAQCSIIPIFHYSVGLWCS